MKINQIFILLVFSSRGSYIISLIYFSFPIKHSSHEIINYFHHMKIVDHENIFYILFSYTVNLAFKFTQQNDLYVRQFLYSRIRPLNPNYLHPPSIYCKFSIHYNCICWLCIRLTTDIYVNCVCH